MNRNVRKYNSGYSNSSTKKSGGFNFKNLILPLIILIVIGYGIYAFISFRNVKTVDPLSNQGSRYYLLSQVQDSFKKTLLVFENGSNGKSKIEHVYIFAENKDREESILIYIPNWLYYGGLERDFGNAVSVSSFRYAGDFLQEGRGIEYAIWQLEQMLGMNVDDYIWFSSDAISSVEENLGDLDGNLSYAMYYSNPDGMSQDSLYINSFLSHLSWPKLILSANKFRDTNATVYSSKNGLMSVVLDLKYIEKNIFDTSPYLFDLSSKNMLIQEESSSIVGVVNYLDTNSFDLAWRDFASKLIDKKLEQERVRVEVYNGSKISGAAYQFARKIENAGCDVVRYDNAPNPIGTTIFYVPKVGDYKESFDNVSELFPGQYELIEGRPSFMTTGDIVILLGEDISKMYSF